MALIDTHTHLYLEQFDEDRPEMLARAREAGLEMVLLPNIDKSSIHSLLQMVKDDPEFCRPMMGLHPCSVGKDVDEQLEAIESALDANDCVAVGEIGLDYYWDTTFKDAQQAAFRKQLNWAKERDLPVAIHSRESMEDVIRIIAEEQDGRLKGVLHCFTGNAGQAAELVELGFYLGIGGVLTYKKSGLGEAIENVPLDRLVLETDSPFLSPVPYRGKRNESAYVAKVAVKLAEIRHTEIEIIESQTTDNALKLFQLQ